MKKAFTLAEVLITVGIIGVIAALTIPAIVQNYRNKLYATRAEKAYSQIEEAGAAILSDELVRDFYQTTAGVTSAQESTDFPEGKGAYYFLNKYFRVLRRRCGANVCIAPGYTTSTGTNAGIIPEDTECVVTVNGYTICMKYDDTSNASTVYLDTNGVEDPNIVGQDAFVMQYNSNGTVRDTATADKCGKKTAETGTIIDYAGGCITDLMNNNWSLD